MQLNTFSWWNVIWNLRLLELIFIVLQQVVSELEASLSLSRKGVFIFSKNYQKTKGLQEGLYKQRTIYRSVSIINSVRYLPSVYLLNGFLSTT
jgi:hypothetical protein